MFLLEKRIVEMEKRLSEDKFDEFDKNVKHLDNIIKKQEKNNKKPLLRKLKSLIHF